MERNGDKKKQEKKMTNEGMSSIVHVAIVVQFSENEILHWQKIRLIGTSANVYTTLCNSKCIRNQTLVYSIFT